MDHHDGMRQDDVLAFLELTDRLGATIWLDGGWGVDACLGRQTRQHSDLDIALQQKDLDVVVDALRRNGYADVPRGDSRPWNFVLGDDAGRLVDFHVVVLDLDGNGIYGPAENGLMYPSDALTGLGSVGGRTVRCISPAWLVRFHTGYDVDDDDWADVSALCAQFGLPVPDDYARWLAS
jgi:lincosamide nucleotidyltransferase A/C/D/E